MDLRKLDRVPSIASVMTPFPYSVDVEDPVSKARQLMDEHQIRHVPVQEGHTLRGVVTEGDLALLLASASSARERKSLKVGQARLGDAYVVELTAPLDRVALEMARRHIGSALVVRGGRLAGIFTATDACRVLGEILAARFRGPGDEAA